MTYDLKWKPVELKTCPFCGNDAETIQHGRWWDVQCTGRYSICQVWIDQAWPSEDEAIEWWNKRAD